MLDWLKTVGVGEYSHPYYALRRVWRVQSRLAPSLDLSPWVEDGFTKDYPFSVKPDKKLCLHDVMDLYRDYYQGTEFDLSKGMTAGPFGCPYRYLGPKDIVWDGSKPTSELEGAWERPISIDYSGYSFICQGRGWLPDPIGGILWFGPDEAMSTCYVPFYCGIYEIAPAFYTCNTAEVSFDSAWWAFNFLANWATIKYNYIIKDIQEKQNELELAEFEGIKTTDQKALALYKTDHEKARQLLTTYCKDQANQVVSKWWKLAWLLVAQYDDGFISSPEDMSEKIGYPDDWYKTSDYPDGPTTYKQTKE
jgi:dipeptidase